MSVVLLLYISFLLVTWGCRYFLLNWTLTHDLRLTPTTYESSPDPAPMVSVLIAARDEEKNIVSCLDSLLVQDYPNYEIIVVDDRSTDHTVEVVRQYARRDPRVTLICNKELPVGWTGRNHALHLGASQAQGQFILFVDADTKHCRSSITQAVTFAVENDVDMLSLLIRLDNVSFWAKTIQPILGSMMGIHYPLWKVNNPKSALAYANGQYILMRREAYEKIGGRAAIRSEFMDKVLAERVKQAGLTLKLVYAPRVAQAATHETLREIGQAWSRIFYGGLDGSLSKMSLGVLMMLVFSLSPYFVLIGSGAVLLAGAGASSRPLGIVFVVSLLTVLVEKSVMLMLYRACHSDARYVLLHLLGCLVALGILLSAVAKRYSRTGFLWKGVQYQTQIHPQEKEP